jgi:predicted transcriptional regulator of viral defense system
MWYIIAMEFERLLEIVGDEPVFETGLLLAGADAQDVRRQLSRWTSAGRLFQLRRGLYALAPPYQRVRPHPFLVANRLVGASYVSLQAALAFYGLIPETVPVVTSVTTGRPGVWDTPLGRYEYRHIKPGLLYGYTLVEVIDGQRAFVATPEKALLDLVYLTPDGDTPYYVRELRPQNLDQLDMDRLAGYADQADSPKLRRAAQIINALALEDAGAYETL